MLVEGTFDHMFNIWAEEFNLMRDGTGFYRVPLIQTITCILLSLYILHMSASRASYWQVILSISIGLATAGPSCFFKSQCSNRHVETNPLSIFSVISVLHCLLSSVWKQLCHMFGSALQLFMVSGVVQTQVFRNDQKSKSDVGL